MSLSSQVKEKLTLPQFYSYLTYLYVTTPSGAKLQANRYYQSICSFESLFGENRDIHLFSAPGRTEVCGNHTDHQRGHVLAASVNMDMIAVVSCNQSNQIKIHSEGYDCICIDLSDCSIHEEEKNTTSALVRGIASFFLQLGYPIQGFDAYITSDVLKGSGLSSSAAFEVLIGTILNCLFCEGKESSIKIAQIGQYAENNYFGKPSGLEDQMASSVGGFVTIDFADAENPDVQKIDFDFSSSGYSLCIIDTGGSHANLTPDYASIPTEMKSIAAFFGKQVLSEVNSQDFYENIHTLRKKCGDRSILRAIHFFDEDVRVTKAVQALRDNQFETFRQYILESGLSSSQHLQNCYSCSSPQEQGVPLALALCKKILGDKGAYRVHGGGFAGTIQAFVPQSFLTTFQQQIEAVFGAGKCHILAIRPVGGVEIHL